MRATALGEDRSSGRVELVGLTIPRLPWSLRRLNQPTQPAVAYSTSDGISSRQAASGTASTTMASVTARMDTRP